MEVEAESGVGVAAGVVEELGFGDVGDGGEGDWPGEEFERVHILRPVGFNELPGVVFSVRPVQGVGCEFGGEAGGTGVEGGEVFVVGGGFGV